MKIDLGFDFISQSPPGEAYIGTLVIRAFAIRVFAYPRFYFSIMTIINILSAATVEAAVQAH
jgi:hypothetical protein